VKVVISGELRQIINCRISTLRNVLVIDFIFCITSTFLLSAVGLAGFALTNNSVLVLPLTKEEAEAAVAANTASVWPSNLMDTSITPAEASGSGINETQLLNPNVSAQMSYI
jgi:hypothetical protein